MRALPAIAAFLLASLGFTGRAAANVPLWAPRVPLSLALDWNKVAVTALTTPPPKPPERVRRHTVPKLTVTMAAPAPAHLDVVAYHRIETLVRDVAAPHYTPRDADYRRRFRRFTLVPFTPYVGAYGLGVRVDSDALLR